jgi:hypothetical protein
MFSLRGKQWSVEEERQLRELLSGGVCVDEIAKVMGKTRLAIRGKMNNLGLTVVVAAAKQHTQSTTTITTTTSKPANLEPELSRGEICEADKNSAEVFAAQLKKEGPLPSIEEKLRVLDAALAALQQPGLSNAEVSRLNKIILGVKVYQPLFAQYVNYSALENEVMELKRQLASEREQK